MDREEQRAGRSAREWVPALEADPEVLELWELGAPVEGIAGSTGAPEEAVEAAVALAVLEGRTEPRKRPERSNEGYGESLDLALETLRDRGATLLQAARALSVSPTTAKRRCLWAGIDGWTQSLRHWTEAEDRALEAMAKEGLPARKCAERLGRTASAVHQRAKTLGVRFGQRPPADEDWTDEEDALLLGAKAGGITRDEAARLLGKPVSEVKRRATLLRTGFAPRPRAGAWTEEEVAALRRASEERLGAAWAAEATGRTVHAVQNKAQKLGLPLVDRSLRARSAEPGQAGEETEPEER